MSVAGIKDELGCMSVEDSNEITAALPELMREEERREADSKEAKGSAKKDHSDLLRRLVES